jgi:hypothetical protein
MKVEDLEEAILKLPPDDLARFRIWFAEFESGMAAPKTGQQAMATKLGRFAGKAMAELRKRAREP